MLSKRLENNLCRYIYVSVPLNYLHVVTKAGRIHDRVIEPDHCNDGLPVLIMETKKLKSVLNKLQVCLEALHVY